MAKKKAVQISIKFSLPPQRDFQTANEKGLSDPFDALDAAEQQGDAAFAVLLHPSYDKGDAVGYTKELIAEIKAVFPHFKANQIRWEYFGSEIRGQSLLLLGSRKPVHLGNAGLERTTYGERHPNVVRHAPKNFNLNSLEHNSGVRYGFEYSHREALPEIELWANKRLVVEELSGDTILPRRLTKEEIAEVYGVEAIVEVNDLIGKIPKVVVDRLGEIIVETMEV